MKLNTVTEARGLVTKKAGGGTASFKLLIIEKSV
jgi:hypothetical protein